MDVRTTISVPDYLFRFYKKASTYAKCTPEEIMVEALFLFSGTVSEKMLADARIKLSESRAESEQDI